LVLWVNSQGPSISEIAVDDDEAVGRTCVVAGLGGCAGGDQGGECEGGELGHLDAPSLASFGSIAG
jgi:hypothetical protein